MKRTTRTIKPIGLLLVLMTLSLSILSAPSAQAIMRDEAVVGRLEDQRQTLLLKERNKQHDYDDLQRQIREMQKRYADPKMIDQLARDADRTYNDLKGIQYDIRQLEMRML